MRMLTYLEVEYIKSEIERIFLEEVFKSVFDDLEGVNSSPEPLEKMFLALHTSRAYIHGAVDNHISECEFQDIYSAARALEACGERIEPQMFSGFINQEVKYVEVETVNIPVQGLPGDAGEQGEDGVLLTLTDFNFNVESNGDLNLNY